MTLFQYKLNLIGIILEGSKIFN